MERKSLGERIGPKWAFFGVGILGIYPLLAVVIGVVAVFGSISSFSFMPLPFRLLSLEIISSKTSTVIAILVALILIVFPGRVIWTSMRTVKRRWIRQISKTYVVCGIFVSLLAPPLSVFYILTDHMSAAMTPILEVNDETEISDSLNALEKNFGITLSKETTVILSIFYKFPVLDYEYDRNLVLKLNQTDLEKYFGNNNLIALDWGRPNLKNIPSSEADLKKYFGYSNLEPKSKEIISNIDVDCFDLGIEQFCSYLEHRNNVLYKAVSEGGLSSYIVLIKDKRLLWFHQDQT
jgi:hypothetical protein